jgi:hypothetical protein
MNQFNDWLSEGDLRTDGRSDEVVETVLNNPGYIDDLMSCLEVENPVVRGHASDAIEKIGREKPEFFLPYLHLLLRSAIEDPVSAVKWHIAMLFGHLVLFSQAADPMIAALFSLLENEKSLVVNWAIKSLSIFAKVYPDYQAAILGNLIALENDKRSSVKVTLRKAKRIILSNVPFPAKWIKSPIVEAQLGYY